ncbi:flagellar filament capping protein FliD [Campylobacter sp.]|uniref:flagellar filament capping protein FliD n=1 Tax=Campylobacter sp. TaxID=205 RepID=UPI002708711B|nr:flagellar filament capping protein FliD [Campylobacter sp.]
MALGKISSLGLGSSVLTQEVIDKLKAADHKGLVDPISKNMEKNVVKQKDLSAIKTLVNSFKSSVAALGDETMFLKRNVSANGKSAELQADPGVGLQDIEIDVKQLAQKDIYQSKKFTAPESFVAKEGSFGIKFGNNTYKIDVKQSTSFEELAAKINDATNGEVQARVLKAGGDKPYQLILQSKNTGSENKIEFSTDDGSGNPLTNANEILAELGWDSASIAGNKISTAQDAEFTYNGVTITRSTNSVKDLNIGLNLTLKESGKTTFSIKEDTKDIKTEIDNIVKNYNSLINNLNAATDYNSETKNAGTFQGVSEITSIKSTINKALFENKSITIDGKTKNLNLTDFGFELTKDGLLKVDHSTLNQKLDKNLDEAKMLFTGSVSFSQVITGSSKPVDAGAITIANEQFTINGKKITLNTPASNSSKENAIALLKAINEAGIGGVQASLNQTEDRIVLKSIDGTNIEVKGDPNILDKLGLANSNIGAKKTSTDGIFTNLNAKLKAIVGKEGSLTIYDKNLVNEKKKLTEDKERAVTDLNTKYDMMAERFLAYDKMISNLQNQFSTLKSMIDAELNAKR